MPSALPGPITELPFAVSVKGRALLRHELPLGQVLIITQMALTNGDRATVTVRANDTSEWCTVCTLWADCPQVQWQCNLQFSKEMQLRVLGKPKVQVDILGRYSVDPELSRLEWIFAEHTKALATIAVKRAAAEKERAQARKVKEELAAQRKAAKAKKAQKRDAEGAAKAAEEAQQSAAASSEEVQPKEATTPAPAPAAAAAEADAEEDGDFLVDVAGFEAPSESEA
eukprot:NODE_5643_length_923_cov_123.898750_g5420_i0.p1 GENE.NODE_5643_length_923_cov_123.898750_g5420_i0~~NODE_5643_length_923_cov_123.898750_g5420_i0.p1  ORF type:complete len:248 (+),score=45.32 NODE_5643_length_923_cov_123.898750_g5420_i0:66-746(+)